MVLGSATLVLAACSVPDPDPTPSPMTTPVPEVIEEFFDAAVAGDLDTVQAHLQIWNEDAGRDLAPDEISLECAEAEAAAVAAKVTNPDFTAYVYTATEPWILRFEAEDGSSEGWGIVPGNDTWLWQPQADACLALWNSPSPSPS
jgi:hypothetical protein